MVAKGRVHGFQFVAGVRRSEELGGYGASYHQHALGSKGVAQPMGTVECAAFPMLYERGRVAPASVFIEQVSYCYDCSKPALSRRLLPFSGPLPRPRLMRLGDVQAQAQPRMVDLFLVF